MPITSRTVSEALPGSRTWDDQVIGLCLRVSAAGRKAWYLSYRTRAGQRRGPKLADMDLMTLTEARVAAREWLAKVALGCDPTAEWAAESLSPTVTEVARRWLRDCEATAKPRTIQMYTEILNKYVIPKLGGLKVYTAHYEDIDAPHKAMSKTPYLANRVLAVLSCIFSYAEKSRFRLAGDNPCRHVTRFKEDKRKRYLTKAEAPAVAAALSAHAVRNPQAVAFIYLLMLSGARPIEITTARREWVECVGDGGVLRLPDSKTGARPVFLPPQVMSIIAKLPICQDGRLFSIKSPKHLWSKLRLEAGVPDMRLYDLRHSFASVALGAGYSLSQIGELLGHTSVHATKRYAHLMEDKAHEIAAGTAGLLERMLNSSSSNTGARNERL